MDQYFVQLITTLAHCKIHKNIHETKIVIKHFEKQISPIERKKERKKEIIKDFPT
jgi:DNA-binding transcriptional regulator GbsR (MarR family)